MVGRRVAVRTAENVEAVSELDADGPGCDYRSVEQVNLENIRRSVATALNGKETKGEAN